MYFNGTEWVSSDTPTVDTSTQATPTIADSTAASEAQKSALGQNVYTPTAPASTPAPTTTYGNTAADQAAQAASTAAPIVYGSSAQPVVSAPAVAPAATVSPTVSALQTGYYGSVPYSAYYQPSSNPYQGYSNTAANEAYKNATGQNTAPATVLPAAQTGAPSLGNTSADMAAAAAGYTPQPTIADSTAASEAQKSAQGTNVYNYVPPENQEPTGTSTGNTAADQAFEASARTNETMAQIAADEAEKRKATEPEAPKAETKPAEEPVVTEPTPTPPSSSRASVMTSGVPTLEELSNQAMANANRVAMASQGGAVNSAEAAGRAAGLSPTQAALLGAQQGSSAYQSALGSAYGQGLGAGTSLASTAANKEVGLTSTQNAYDLGMANVKAGVKGQEAAGLGAALSAGASLLPWIFTLLENGSDSAPGGPTIVGENGPELINLPQGAKVYPSIKTGYDMLNYITKQAKSSKQVNPPPQLDSTNQEVSTVAMIQALDDKLNRVAQYIKKGGR